MGNLVLTLLVGLGLVFSGCEEKEKSSSNRLPMLTQKKVVEKVGERKVFSYDVTSNVTDSDGDLLSVKTLVMADGSALPSGISLVGNKLSVADSISVDDGKSKTYDMKATVSDGRADVSYELSLVIEDGVNDNLLKYTLRMVDTIDSNATMELNVALSDIDGLFSNTFSYTIVDKNNSNNVVYRGRVSDADGNGDFTDSFNLAENAVVAGEYRFQMVVPTVVGGETPQGDVNITHDFEVVSKELPTVVSKSSEENATTEVEE
jgi:hypothetical protein